MYGLDENRKKPGGGGGGGGKARIRFGRTGPRGRAYTKPAKGPVAVVKSKFIKAGDGARPAIREHLKYIQDRERGPGEPERKFFDREREGIERKEVYNEMLQNRGDRAAMHTLILSPGDNKVDLVEYTRESMEALEDRLGHKLDWYGVIHKNTDHHHAHITIAGKVPDREREVERQGAQEKEPSGIDDNRWTGEDQALRELLGDKYDEKAVLDPREERANERSRWDTGEREPADPAVKDLIGEGARSPEEMRTERMLDRYEWQMGAHERNRDRGEVYFDRNDLNELRGAGNDYLARERSFDRELEHSAEREMQYEHNFAFEHDREREFERDDRSDRGREEDDRGSDFGR